MDVPFAPEFWHPTTEDYAWEKEPTDADITALIADLNRKTKVKDKYPYDPWVWLHRAITLFRMRYPELVVGDAHKAIKLAKAHLRALTSPPSPDKPKYRFGRRFGFMMGPDPELDQNMVVDEDAQMWMLSDGKAVEPTVKDTDVAEAVLSDPEFDLSHDEEYHKQLVQYLRKLRTKAMILKNRCLVHLRYLPREKSGAAKRLQYPWMDSKMLERSDELLRKINEEYEANARQVLHRTDGPVCEIFRGALGVGGPEGDKILGVRAARDISKGEMVLIDTTQIWGSNDPSVTCKAKDLTVSDIRWILEKTDNKARSALQLVRLLKACVDDGVDHPLNHPSVTGLTPTYSDKIAEFSWTDDIRIPNEMLTRMKIDIFSNSAYDSWVVLQLQYRLFNNQCEEFASASTYRMFSLFNHSCEPNVEWRIDSQNHTTLYAQATEKIKKSEQMFVSYDAFLANMPVEERRKRLEYWINGPCLCTRCLREEDYPAEAMKEADEAEEDDGEGSQDEGLVMRCRKKAHKKTAPGEKEEKGEWDIPASELPKFPEDSYNVRRPDTLPCW